jgi:hypothetical protein
MIDKIFPSDSLLPLKFLAGKDWLDIQADPELGSLGGVKSGFPITEQDLRQYGKETIRHAKRIIETYAGMGSSSMFLLLQVSKAIADGPKLFRPTYNQCLALENVEVTVPFENYKQPYPVVILELPREYQERIKTVMNVRAAPAYVIAHKVEPQNVIAVTAWFGPDNVIVNVLGPKDAYKTIEDALVGNRDKSREALPDFDKLKKYYGQEGAELLQKSVDLVGHNPMDFDVAELAQRLGINFSMMMTTLGTTVGEPINTSKERVAKNKKVAASSKYTFEERHRAQRLLAPVTYEVKLDQEIEFFHQESEKVRAVPGESTDKILRPHWRKGYWRLQWHGPRNSLYKYKYIHSVRVNKELDTVDLMDTSVTYTGRDDDQNQELQP